MTVQRILDSENVSFQADFDNKSKVKTGAKFILTQYCITGFKNTKAIHKNIKVFIPLAHITVSFKTERESCEWNFTLTTLIHTGVTPASIQDFQNLYY
eukprot:Pgem_evm1s9324